MEPTRNLKPLKAAWMLMLATFFWGISFLTQKALVMSQQQLSGETNTWVLTSMSIVFRFGLAGLILLVWNFSSLRKITWLELYEGAVLGIVGGVGLLFQMDGVNYTSASTAAFLTQCYCIFIPLLVACRLRQWPSRRVTISTAMVLTGVAILSQFSFREMNLGRGELETLVASLFFTAQILWLERPLFAKNRAANFSVVMFLVTALIFLPVVLAQGGVGKITIFYSAPAPVVLNLILTFFCTIVAYGLMNHWQPHVSATQAGLIYCAEPVFTSVFALFVPALFSTLAHISYANETVTIRQLIGGSLILAANALVLLQAARAKPEAQQRLGVLEAD